MLTASPYRRPPWGALALLLVLLSGCASQLEYRELTQAPGDLPRQAELAATPFYPQTAHHCGPASLAMLLDHAGVSVAPEQLGQLTYLPGRAGSLGLELLATPRQYGLLGYRVTPSLTALFQEVAAGRPVLVLQNLGLSWLPRWHYAVVIGYDLDAEEVLLRSGTTRRQVMPMDTFEHTWRRGQRWAMLTLAPGEMPAVAREADYLKAIVGLEQVGAQAAAARAYRQALEQWPNSRTAWMAWGNNRYAAGAVDAAEGAYRQVLALDGRFAPAYNNLAQVLLDRGELTEAERMARRAVEHAGSHRAIYRQTVREIATARRQRESTR